jgi:hypothetical protein
MNESSRRAKARFSLKQLLSLVTLSAFLMLGGILIHRVWLDRQVETVVPLRSLAVETLRPHQDWILAEHDDVILDIRFDPRINCVIVTSAYRNREAAIRAIQELESSQTLTVRPLLSADVEQLPRMLDQNDAAVYSKSSFSSISRY